MCLFVFPFGTPIVFYDMVCLLILRLCLIVYVLRHFTAPLKVLNTTEISVSHSHYFLADTIQPE